MKTRFAVLIAAFGLLAVAVDAETPPSQAGVRRAVDAGNAAFVAAYKNGDARAFAAIFDDAGALLEKGGETIVGRAGIEKGMAKRFQTGRMEEGTITTTDIFVFGDLAYETGRYDFVFRKAVTEHRTGRYVEVWKRQADGEWKMYRDIGLPD